MKITRFLFSHRAFHLLVTISASLLVLSGVILAIWFYIFYKNHEETNDAQVEQYVTPIIARVTGYIEEIRYEENQFVHKGDTLIIIDDREFKAKVDLAQAEIENAEKNIDVLQKTVEMTSNNVSVRKSQLDAAKAEMWKTKKEYDRYSELYKEEAATMQQVEKVKTDYDAAKSHYNEILSSISVAHSNTGEAKAKIPTAEAVIKAKKAVADNANLILSYTVITAPYDGWVGRKLLQPGQLVKEGQALVSMVSQEKWVTANFKETQIEYLAVGQKVTLEADAISSHKFEGTVESLSPASGARFSLLPPDNATGNFVKIEQRIPVRIQIDETDPKSKLLKAGMNVIVVAKHN